MTNEVEIIDATTHFILCGKTKPHRHWIKVYHGKWDPITQEWSIPKTEKLTQDELVGRVNSWNADEKKKRSERTKKAWRHRKEETDPEQIKKRVANFESYLKAHAYPYATVFVNHPHQQCYACKRFVFAETQVDFVSGCICGRVFE